MKNKRVCFCEVEFIAPGGVKVMKRLDGLAIKGTVNRKAGTVQADATIQIANLSQATVEYITTYSSPYFSPKVQKRINIYAGYEETGWGQIFTGDIVEARPTGMPDVWLNIKAKSLNYSQRVPISYGAADITTKDLGESIAQELGLSFDWQATSEKTISIFDFIGSKAELIKEYNKLEDVVMYEDNGILKVQDKKEAPPLNAVKVLSAETGLIGEVEPDEQGIKCKCLFDASLECGKWIETKSIKLPGTNGKYQIYTLTFDFSSREQQFYCNIYAKAGKEA